jgi:Cu-Zn family superoxide dismutase
MRLSSTVLMIAGLTAASSGLAISQQNTPSTNPLAGPATTLTVEMRDAKKNLVGTVQIRPTATGTLFTANLMNLPAGGHGFHIHERGVCDAPDFKSAGDHFNPGNREHGFLNPGGPHAGDLPNVFVDKQGQAIAEFHSTEVTLDPPSPAAAQAQRQTTGEGSPQPGQSPAAGARHSLSGPAGTALILHSDLDDYKDADSAGARIACGVIKAPS